MRDKFKQIKTLNIFLYFYTIDSASEVSKPIIFTIIIIIIVFLPLFTLKGIEGKIFSPMAFAITFALVGSLFFAIFIAPVLSIYFLKIQKEKEFKMITILKSYYKPMLEYVLKRKKV